MDFFSFSLKIDAIYQYKSLKINNKFLKNFNNFVDL